MVFFDYTKPSDERPEVLDIFADAIGCTVSTDELTLLMEYHLMNNSLR